MTNLIDMRTLVENWEFPFLFISETAVAGQIILRNLITSLKSQILVLGQRCRFVIEESIVPISAFKFDDNLF